MVHAIFQISRRIKVKTSFDALHCWPNAPEEVAFLRNPHRHQFHVTVILSVVHEDRDLEFFIIKDRVDYWLHRNFDKCDLGPMSCETMGEQIGTYLDSLYPNRLVSVEVAEDGINSAIISYERVTS